MRYILTVLFIILYVATFSSEPISNKTIEGKWSSKIASEYYGIKEIEISKINDNRYRIKITTEYCKARKVEDVILDENNEYHTNNTLNQYYKTDGEILKLYDDNGFLYYYWRK